MQVPLLDLKAQYATIKDEIDAAVQEVFESQCFIGGPAAQECEERIAEYCNCPHAVGVSSGGDALLISLMAEEIGPGDEVIMTPYTFFATVGCISRVGATPVFVDICPDTYNIAPPQSCTAPRAPTRTASAPLKSVFQCFGSSAMRSARAPTY